MSMHFKGKKSKKNKVINKIIFIIILLIISIIYTLKIFNEKAVPQFLEYSKIEVKRIVSLLINKEVTNTIQNTISYDELFITNKDNEGNITYIDFNSKEVNRILNEVSKVVENNINYLSKGDIDKLSNIDSLDKKKLKKGIIYELPSGIVFNNILLNNIFPKIPVKIDLISNVFCLINTDIKPYGINNALIKVNITIKVSVKILLPFVSDSFDLVADVPVIMKLIEGSVPSYYFDGYLNNPIKENK